MAVLEKLRRVVKLGLFVGAGTAVALVSACSSAVKRFDTGPLRDSGPHDAARKDAAPRDAGVADGVTRDGVTRDGTTRDGASRDGAPRDLGRRDKRSWDIPLE